MKKFLLTMMVLGGVLAAQGQQNDVMTATLQHGNELTVFRMANALVEAHNAAVDGDIITLSEGTFNSLTISKSITIYGAGFENDDVTGTRVSLINGRIYCIDTLSNVHIEGCKTGDIYVNPNSGNVFVESLCIRNCCVNGSVTFGRDFGDAELFSNVITGYVSGGNVTFTSLRVNNCYIGGAVYGFPALSPVVVDHSIMNGYTNGAYYYTNDIFSRWDDRVLAAESNVTNCIISWPSVINNVHYVDCYTGIGDIFSDGGGSYSADRTFELQQPDVWIGTDGTQIGLHGGQGWSKVPRIPVIKSLNMNVEGQLLKLNFEAEVRE